MYEESIDMKVKLSFDQRADQKLIAQDWVFDLLYTAVSLGNKY